MKRGGHIEKPDMEPGLGGGRCRKRINAHRGWGVFVTLSGLKYFLVD